MNDDATDRLIALAAARYAPAGPFFRHFARGKLKHDPIYLDLLRRGALPDGARLLDLGCGLGLLFALLGAARRCHDAGIWPPGWPAPPRVAAMHGIELDAAKVRAARRALADIATVVQGDLCRAALPESDVIVIVDVLHYIADGACQARILHGAAHALRKGGKLLLRVGDTAAAGRFRLTHLTDYAVQMARGVLRPRFRYRGVAEWTTLLEQAGFSVTTEPMRRGTPFANHLLTARLGPRPQQP
jgi:SAM-dependent methyltransferase